MIDITKIPESELQADWQESQNDIGVCEAALKLGIEIYSGGKVQDRLDGNRKIMARIEAELARRDAVAENHQRNIEADADYERERESAEREDRISDIYNRRHP